MEKKIYFKILSNFGKIILWITNKRHYTLLHYEKSAGVGDITFQKLIEEFGSAERVWLDAPKILKNINKFNKNVSSEIGNEHHLDFAKKS